MEVGRKARCEAGCQHDGWGATLGHPRLVLDSDAPAVQVFLFESADLPDHWTRLDDFEGAEYTRTVAQVSTTNGEVSAWIYVVAQAADSSADRGTDK